MCHPRIKRTIIKSILNQTDVSLKEITDKLGAGIYLDFGCSGLVMKIFDPLKNRYKIVSPDEAKNVDLFLPFYNVIQEGMEEIGRYSKMSWNNIVSRTNDVELTETQRNLSRKSKRFRKDTTELQKASQKSRLFTEQHMRGGKKKTKKKNHAEKLKEKQKRKIKNKKTRRRKIKKENSQKKSRKIYSSIKSK